MNNQYLQNFDFKNAEDVPCKECGSNVYETVVTLKKVPANVSPTGQSAVGPIPIFKCVQCGALNMDYYQQN